MEMWIPAVIYRMMKRKCYPCMWLFSYRYCELWSSNMATRLILEQQRKAATLMEVYCTANFLHCSKGSLFTMLMLHITKKKPLHKCPRVSICWLWITVLRCDSTELIWVGVCFQTREFTLSGLIIPSQFQHEESTQLHVCIMINTLPSHFQELHVSLSHSSWVEWLVSAQHDVLLELCPLFHQPD
jgi:hypothetical protein